VEQAPGGRQAAADRLDRVAARLQVEQPTGGAELGRCQQIVGRQLVEKRLRQRGVAQVAADHPAAHRPRRRREGHRQQETAQEGRVHAVGVVGDPHGGDGVLLEHPVHPALLAVGRRGRPPKSARTSWPPLPKASSTSSKITRQSLRPRSRRCSS
jgi:hypothetical protein